MGAEDRGARGPSIGPKRRRRLTPRDRRGGFVLLAVLGVTALLSGMVVALSYVARTSVVTATIATEQLQADALVTAGVELAGFQLFAQSAAPASLTGQQIRLDDGTVTLFATSERTRIDLNGSSLDLLAGLYRDKGLGAISPQAFAARVVDWRDKDDTPSRRDNGEASAYAAAGLDYEPTNRPFRTVSELRYVLGVTPADVAALAPFLTVNNPRGRIDVNAAPPDILAAIPLMHEETVSKILAMRADGGRIDLDDENTRAILANVISYFDTDPLGPARVRIEARPKSGRFLRTVELVMIPSAVKNRLYQVTAWHDS